MFKSEIVELLEKTNLMRIFNEHASEYGNGNFDIEDYPELVLFVNEIIESRG